MVNNIILLILHPYLILVLINQFYISDYIYN